MNLLLIILGVYLIWYLPHILVNAWKGPQYLSNKQANLVSETIPCTLVVPCYNEAERIGELLQSLVGLNPRPQEILFVDDGSTDGTANLIREKGFTVLNNEQQVGKKGALSTGILAASQEIIVTTDADCSMDEKWLELLYSAHQEGGFTFGLVEFLTNGKMFPYYQWMENRALSAITQSTYHLGVPLMCNGANLMFDKQLWEDCKGYELHAKEPSGDDVFFLHQVWKKNRHLIQMQPNAVVYTHTKPNLAGFMRQRKRWAAKSLKYQLGFATFFTLMTAMLNLLVLAGLVLLLGKGDWVSALTLLVVKALVDYLVMISTRTKSAFCVSFPMVVQFQIFQLLYPFILPFYKSDWSAKRPRSTENA